MSIILFIECRCTDLSVFKLGDLGLKQPALMMKGKNFNLK